MSKRVNIILTSILWIIIIVSSILVVSLFVNIEDPMTMKGEALVDSNLRWAYALMVSCIGVIAIFSVMQMIDNGKKALRGLMSLAFMGLVVFAAYSMASDAIPQFTSAAKLVAEGSLTPTVAKVSDTLLFTSYLLAFGAVLSIVWSSVSRIWR